MRTGSLMEAGRFFYAPDYSFGQAEVSAFVSTPTLTKHNTQTDPVYALTLRFRISLMLGGLRVKGDTT